MGASCVKGNGCISTTPGCIISCGAPAGAGLYQSTPHRVLNADPTRSRVSIPFFYEPAFDAQVGPWIAPLLTWLSQAFSGPTWHSGAACIINPLLTSQYPSVVLGAQLSAASRGLRLILSCYGMAASVNAGEYPCAGANIHSWMHAGGTCQAAGQAAVRAGVVRAAPGVQNPQQLRAGAHCCLKLRTSSSCTSLPSIKCL